MDSTHDSKTLIKFLASLPMTFMFFHTTLQEKNNRSVLIIESDVATNFFSKNDDIFILCKNALFLH